MCLADMNDFDEAVSDRLLELFDDYAGVIKALLVRIVRDEEEAEDLLADIFAKAWEESEDLDVEPLPVLIAIARERGLEWVRSNGTPEPVDNCTVAQTILSDSPLGKLPKMQRRIVEHVFFDGGSISRFALEVNASRDWVSAALAHALCILWEDCGNEEIHLRRAYEAYEAASARNSHDRPNNFQASNAHIVRCRRRAKKPEAQI